LVPILGDPERETVQIVQTVLESIGDHALQPVVSAVWADPRAMLGLLRLARSDEWAMTWTNKVLREVFPDPKHPTSTALPPVVRRGAGDGTDPSSSGFRV